MAAYALLPYYVERPNELRSGASYPDAVGVKSKSHPVRSLRTDALFDIGRKVSKHEIIRCLLVLLWSPEPEFMSVLREMYITLQMVLKRHTCLVLYDREYCQAGRFSLE